MDILTVFSGKRYPWLRHGFSTRHSGVSTVYGDNSLNLGWTKEDDPKLVAENRIRFAHAIAGSEESLLVTLRQMHGKVIHSIDVDNRPPANEQGRAILEGDGLMTRSPGVLLGIQTADCVPVILIDPELRVVAVFHAGWRGTVAGIVEQGVARMREEYGSSPETMLAAVGPSIGACCYVVGEEVQTAFHERFVYALSLFDGQRLNLWEANRRQLIHAGVPETQITVVGECTGCALTSSGRRKYFSHRMDHGVTGRMMTLVGMDEPD